VNSLSAPFGEVGIRDTIRSNRARRPSRYLHKITLIHTSTLIKHMLITIYGVGCKKRDLTVIAP